MDRVVVVAVGNAMYVDLMYRVPLLNRRRDS